MCFQRISRFRGTINWYGIVSLPFGREECDVREMLSMFPIKDYYGIPRRRSESYFVTRFYLIGILKNWETN